MKTIQVIRYQSPAGDMIVGSYDGRLCICDWAIGESLNALDSRVCRYLNAVCEEKCSEITRMAAMQLDEYFAGIRREFSLPVIFSGTDFQCRVWRELMRIPYGQTVSYAEVARRIGNARAVRAAATAIASNPISIFVPCHRVVGSDRTLTGYRGGLAAKRYLLALESASQQSQR